jgi:RNA polymerase sigma-70 factor (ECF subfamily)
MPASFSGDSQHVLRCLAGDRDAFGPLVQRYQNAAYAIALNYVRNRADAQDIVQDAFVTAYCKLVQLRDPTLFGAWLRRIVVTSCKEWLRRQRSAQSYVYPLDVAEEDLADAAGVEDLNQTRRADLWDAVDRLPEHYRSVVLMHYLSGLSYEEIGAFLDVPVSTVRGRLQQSRIRLRAALLPVEKEEIVMNQIDVTKAVRDAVCQIATERFREVIPLGDAPHVVLYCGVDTDVEVREAEGDDIILEGTKASIGFSQEAAQASVQRIEILADRVENFLESGPHEGEVYTGTNSNKEGQPVGTGASAGVVWRAYVQDIWGSIKGNKVVDLYPVLKEHMNDLPGEMRDNLEHVVRVSILRKRMEDIVMPREACTPDVLKVFRQNYSDEKVIHGPVGYVNAVLSVPVSKVVTIVRGRTVRANGLHASINTINSYGVELSRIEGDVRLFNSQLKTAQGIRGKVYQRFYEFGGTSLSEYRRRRQEAKECKIEDVEGEVDIDVGRVLLEAAHLSGPVRIYNRYGTTRLYQSDLKPGNRFCLESCSGEVLLFLKEDLIHQVGLTVHTICGDINYSALKELGELNSGNDAHVVVLSTIRSPRSGSVLDADFYVKTESGDVTIEKMK